MLEEDYTFGHHRQRRTAALMTADEMLHQQSPLVVNGQTYSEYMDMKHEGMVARRLEKTSTALSNECKFCID